MISLLPAVVDNANNAFARSYALVYIIRYVIIHVPSYADP